MPTAVYSDRPSSILAHLNPVRMLSTLFSHRALALQLARRDIEARYKSQRLGLLWAVLNPLILLAIYTFVFAVVFPSRLGTAPEEHLGLYALNVFLGLVTFGLFRDLFNHAPALVVSNRNYVKRVVFPLEILAIADFLACLFTMAIGLAVWLVGYVAIMRQPPPPEALLFPVLIIPVALLALAASWFLSALTVFVRDLSNAVEMASTVLFFLTPIFYSLENLPPRFRALLQYNPLAQAVEGARAVMIRGQQPDWLNWSITLAAAALAALGSYAFFTKARRAFADVL
ncbi:MAG: ABC transporter permease [Phycisphaerae bacterium]|nr:ABC transporter permease [Phycisphaerae bacterium]